MIIKHGSYRVIYNSLMDLWDEAVVSEAQIRAGICPDCGNDKCMADGKTGLWCPNCDASYLLEQSEFEHNTGANHEAHNGESSSKEATREKHHRRDSRPDGHGDDVRPYHKHTAV